MNVTTRRTTAADGVTLRDLRLAALEDAPYAFGQTLQDALALPASAFEEDAVRHSSSDRSTSFIAQSGDAAIGMIGAFFEEATNRAFICALWVAPSHRGSTAAESLVQAAAEWFKERAAIEIFAWVAEDNSRALAFYENVGFVDAGERQVMPSNDEAPERLYRYVHRGS